MIRVAHILQNMTVGGRERTVADLCAHAADVGIAPVVILYEPDTHDIAQVELPPDVEVIRIDGPALLAETLDRLRIHIAHAHSHVPGYHLARSGWRTGKRMATLHIAPTLREWTWIVPVSWQLRKLDRVIAVSDALGTRWSRFIGEGIDTIPTGVDISRFSWRHPQPVADVFRIAMVSRLHPIKRHQDMFAALRLLAATNPQIELHIAGEGDPGFVAQLRQMAPPNVQFDGRVADVPRYLSDKHVFVICSDHEASPLALLEAMASGVPVVATRVGGIADIARDAALLVERRNPSALAAAIAQLCSDPALRLALALKGRERAKDFSVQRQSESYACLYRDLLSGN